MIQLELSDEPNQSFSVILDDARVTLHVWYSGVTDRWSLDVSVDGEPVLYGRRIVAGVDLLAPFNLGIGILFAWPEVAGAVPDRTALPLGNVAVYHTTQEEVDAAISA